MPYCEDRERCRSQVATIMSDLARARGLTKIPGALEAQFRLEPRPVPQPWPPRDRIAAARAQGYDLEDL